MSARRGQFAGILASALLVLILCVFLAKSVQNQRKTRSEGCVRICMDPFQRLKRKVTRFSSCYHKCLYKTNGAIAQQGLFRKIINHRRRKALPPNYSCPDSSPSQTDNWRPEKINVTFGRYDDTCSWYVNVSWTPMKDTNGKWNATLVSFIVPSSEPSFMNPVNCSVLPKNQTFLQVNLSSSHCIFSGSIFVRILGLPYKGGVSQLLFEYKPDTPPGTISPRTKAHLARRLISPTETALGTISPRTKAPRLSFPTKKECVFKEFGDLVWYPTKVNVDFVQRQTGYWYANISWTPLTDPKVSWKGYLVTILLGNVDQSRGYSTPKCFQLPKNQTSMTLNSSNGWKYPNDISLNVTAFPYRKKARQFEGMTTFYPKKPNYSGRDTTTPSPTLSSRYTITSSSPSSSQIIFAPSTPSQPVTPDITLIVFSAVGGPTIILALWLLYRLWKRVKNVQNTKKFKYHAFVIYSMCDADLVNSLFSVLESNGLRCCIHWRDFVPGRPYVDNIVESIRDSFKIIAVLSRDFNRSECCKFEFQQTLDRLMNNGDDCLILIVLDNEVISNLPGTILRRSYIDFTNLADRSTWESRLVRILRTADIIEEDDSNSDSGSNSSSTASEGTAFLPLE
ncbi:uncharacterized protein [Montipora capricornis]|uniref:uncharacterized protein isoform X3 n=1 Tax=Montipora capricornis TaxID=246305 RepID=UPI0035F11D29